MSMSIPSAEISTGHEASLSARAPANTRHDKAIFQRVKSARFFFPVMLSLCLLCSSQGVMAQVVEGQFYRIKNVGTKKYLALGDDAKTVVGAQIVQRALGQDDRQQWSFVKQGPFFKIINRQNGQALNVQSASMEVGAPIIQWEADVKGKNQRWTLVPHGAYFALKARHSDMVVDVADESTERKAPIVQNTFQNTETQLFEFELVQ